MIFTIIFTPLENVYLGMCTSATASSSCTRMVWSPRLSSITELELSSGRARMVRVVVLLSLGTAGSRPSGGNGILTGELLMEILLVADTVRELLPEILALLVTVEVLLNDLDLLADEVLLRLVEAELLEVPETLLLRLSVAELLLEKDCENEEKEKGAELEGVLDASAVKLELGEWELEGVLEEAVEDLEGVTEQS